MVVINLSCPHHHPPFPSSLSFIRLSSNPPPISLLRLKPTTRLLPPSSFRLNPRPNPRPRPKTRAFGGEALQSAQSVGEAALVLTAIIVVHEAGHFLAARLQGIHVSKFSVGFGPILAKVSWKNVEYSLRAFPLGGFVAFPDNDPDSDIPSDDLNLLNNRPIPDRALVISAGVLANLLFAYLIILIQVSSVGLPVREPFPGVLVPEVNPSSAASRDGIFPGDVVLAVDGAPLPGPGPEAVSELVEAIKRSPERRLVFRISRGGEALDVAVVPGVNAEDGTGRIGVQLSPNARITRLAARSLPEAAVYSWREFSGLSWSVLDGLRRTLSNLAQSAGKVSGPVAIIAVGAEVARSENSDGLFQFAALLNLNLAAVNLLPLPALDGGSLALIAVEAARGGRKLPAEVEQRIMSSGIMAVVLLGLFLIVKDTLSLDFVRDIL